jgi:hypothetical protein
MALKLERSLALSFGKGDLSSPMQLALRKTATQRPSESFIWQMDMHGDGTPSSQSNSSAWRSNRCFAMFSEVFINCR